MVVDGPTKCSQNYSAEEAGFTAASFSEAPTDTGHSGGNIQDSMMAVSSYCTAFAFKEFHLLLRKDFFFLILQRCHCMSKN